MKSGSVGFLCFAGECGHRLFVWFKPEDLANAEVARRYADHFGNLAVVLSVLFLVYCTIGVDDSRGDQPPKSSAYRVRSAHLSFAFQVELFVVAGGGEHNLIDGLPDVCRRAHGHVFCIVCRIQVLKEANEPLLCIVEHRSEWMVS